MRRQVLHARFAIDTATVTREADHIAPAFFGGCLNGCIQFLKCHVVILGITQAIGQRMRLDHRANQAMCFDRFKVGWFQQIDTDHA